MNFKQLQDLQSKRYILMLPGGVDPCCRGEERRGGELLLTQRDLMQPADAQMSNVQRIQDPPPPPTPIPQPPDLKMNGD